MATEKDPLLETLSTDKMEVRSDRLHYATGELLGADDFQSEQLYHRRQLAMTRRFLYGSGTLAGLKVEALPGDKDQLDSSKLDEVQIIVKPGLAIDRAGRLVEVPVPVSLRLKRWFLFITNPEETGDPHAVDQLAAAFDNTKKTVAADIFLRFYPSKRGWTPAFASGPFDSIDASQPGRIRDAYELRMVLRKSSELKIVDPKGNEPDMVTKEQVQEAIFNAWDDLSLPGDMAGDFHEDPTAIRLATLNIPVISNGAPGKVEDLDWTVTTWTMHTGSTDENNKIIDNSIRNFIVPPALLRRLHNL